MAVVRICDICGKTGDEIYNVYMDARNRKGKIVEHMKIGDLCIDCIGVLKSKIGEVLKLIQAEGGADGSSSE